MSTTLDSARFGALVHGVLGDEPFLTLSPALAGRSAGERWLSLFEDAAVPGQIVRRLLSLRRSGAHLFLRYELPRR